MKNYYINTEIRNNLETKKEADETETEIYKKIEINIKVPNKKYGQIKFLFPNKGNPWNI